MTVRQEIHISSSCAETTWFDGEGNPLYPCWCGETHSGRYAIYDWAHHNCRHSEPLMNIGAPEVPNYYMCPDCGLTFLLAEPPSYERFWKRVRAFFRRRQGTVYLIDRRLDEDE